MGAFRPIVHLVESRSYLSLAWSSFVAGERFAPSRLWDDSSCPRRLTQSTSPTSSPRSGGRSPTSPQLASTPSAGVEI